MPSEPSSWRNCQSTVSSPRAGFVHREKLFCDGLYQPGDSHWNGANSGEEIGGEKIYRRDWFPLPLVDGVERGYTFRILVADIREDSMPKTERDREISRRRQKRKKMEFLRGRLAETKDSKARAVLIQKILKINPQSNVPQK